MFDSVLAQAHAMGQVVGATGLPLAGTRGAATARTLAGIYTYTLPANKGLDATECVMFLTSKTTLLVASYAHTSDIIKTATWVTVAAGNAATDCDHDFGIVKTAGGAAL